jgi:hypothetical protein
MIHFLFLLVYSPTAPEIDYIRYYEIAHAAEYQYEFKKNPSKALSLLREAEQISSLGQLEIELKAQCYLQLGDTVNTLKCMRQAILSGSHDVDHLHMVYKNIGKKNMDMVMKDYSELVKQYYCGKNVAVLLELSAMTARDQFVRNERRSFQEDKADWLLTQVDSLNIYRLKELYQATGILPPTFALYWHGLMTFPSLWPYFEPEMRKGIYSGKFNPQNYAMIYDRLRIEVEKKNSWYGEYTDTEMQTAAGGRVDDVENVDARRKAIGLRPLIEMKEIWNWPLPSGYKARASSTSN